MLLPNTHTAVSALSLVTPFCVFCTCVLVDSFVSAVPDAAADAGEVNCDENCLCMGSHISNVRHKLFNYYAIFTFSCAGIKLIFWKDDFKTLTTIPVFPNPPAVAHMPRQLD